MDNTTKGNNIPAYLKENAHWCAWKYEERTKSNGETYMTKVPYNPRTGYGADSTNPATFADCETARAFAKNGYDGLGVGVFDGLCGVDIDHCVNENGELSAMASEIVEAMDTYTEVSPSGTGLRLFFLAPGYAYDKSVYYINNQRAGEKAGYGGEGLEIYVAGMTNKFMTVTGNVIKARGVEERADRLQPILDKFMRRNAGKVDKPKNTAPAMPNSLDDRELLERAFNAYNGDKARRLYDGDMSDYGDDHNSADLALCNILAFWTGRDAMRMDSLFRQSALYRDKWDSRRGNSTYGAITIQKAIDSCDEVYTPGKSAGESNIGVTDSATDSAQDETDEETADDCTDAGAIASAIYLCDGYEEPTATGLLQLDVATNGGLRSGLTIIGATSSAGKTTLCVQIADFIAANGTPVLFVSIEQSGRELVSKTLSRLMAKRGYKAVPVWAMSDPKERERWGTGKTAALLASVEEYTKEIAPNIVYLSSNEQPTVADVENKAKSIWGKFGKPPVIIVDYLQLLAPKNDRDTDKRAADYNVSQLRRMARDMHTPVIAVSSLNRSSYSGVIEMESFKESGGIEYGADLLLGLQPYNMEKRLDAVHGEEKRKKKAKEITDELKRSAVRECEIVVLKNRNGALPPKPLPVTFDCASSLFVDGLPVSGDEGSLAEWMKAQS